MGFKSDATLWLGSILTVGAIGVGSVFGLQALGLPLNPTAAAEAQEDKPLALEWTTTPAYEAMVEVLNVPYPDWTPEGMIQQLASSALPTSCVAGLLGPAGSMTRSYSTPQGRVEVSLSAYPAGAGAGAEAAIRDAVDGCGTSKTLPANPLGASSATLATNPAGVETSTTMWRRGDLITYVSATFDPAPLAALVDAEVVSRLNLICVNQGSAPEEVTRNPWIGRTEYTGLLENAEVRIAEPPLPVIPGSVPSPSPSVSASTPVPTPAPAPSVDPNAPAPVVETAIPAPELPLASVSRPRTPRYPVWPPLPARIEAPVLPPVPTPATTASLIQVSREDTTGPGCGWDFAGTVAPVFDQAAADAKEKADREATLSTLQADAARWQNEVLGYWTAYAAYTDQVKAYNAYAQEVANVRAAWDVIAAQWAIYQRDLESYQVKVQARDNFIADQAAAQAQYDADLAACQVKPAPPAQPAPQPSPAPSGAPGDEAAQPEQPEVVTPACPSRPLILDQTPPEVPAAPTPPADPRP